MDKATREKVHELSAAGWSVYPNGKCVSPMHCVVMGIENAWKTFWQLNADGKKGVNRG